MIWMCYDAVSIIQLWTDALLSVTTCYMFNYFTNWLINFNSLIFSDLPNDNSATLFVKWQQAIKND